MYAFNVGTLVENLMHSNIVKIFFARPYAAIVI